MSAAPAAARRIHIVEDERIVALDLKLQLGELGYAVTGISATAAESISAVEQLRPDLVLMDINLGKGADGISAARSILQRLDLPVVYLTAYAEPDMVRRAGEVAPYGYLLKPVEIRELHATVQMALAQHRERGLVALMERRLRLALDAGQLGVIEFSPNLDLVKLDGHLDPALGVLPLGSWLPRETFLGHLAEAARAQLEAVLEPGKVLHARLEWTMDQGASRWLEIHLANFAQEGLVVGILRDVTDSIAQARELRQAAVVFESAAEAIVILDGAGEVHAVNPAFERITGWRPAQVHGLSPDQFLYHRRQRDQPATEVEDGAEYSQGEVSCRRRDGSHFPAWAQRVPVRDNEGQIAQEVLTLADISALRRAEGQVRSLAYLDSLTGLANRNQFERQLARMSDASVRGGQGFSLLFLDLDGFKTINDGLGHDCGDQLLQALAQRLSMSVRDGDFVARLGGDEFVVLLEVTGQALALSVAEKLRTACEQPVMLAGGELVSISVSIGIAIAPLHLTGATELLRAADTAMYAAKAEGRNRIRMFSPELTRNSRRRLRLEQRLRLALAAGEFKLHYQPIVNLASGRPLAVEALLRWTSPDLGTVPPEEFIPLAEESSLIIDIGAWVVDTALAQLHAWLAIGLPLEHMAINLSARQLRAGNLLSFVSAALERHQLAGSLVEFEVTESTVQSGADMADHLAELRSLGAGLALDDFGTGYSSLSSLKNLPITRVKIDRSFVRGLDLPGRDTAIARAIVELSNAIGLAVIAEGVETAGQCEALRQLGVVSGQGWLFAPAMAASQCTAWLSERMVTLPDLG